ncbi:hypothetical protein [Mesorhizobium sp.]|uniref:hypothetical protein n=1 Tax=Mesorhizobium sp. TaxID=1871066 RepID=UPI000FEA8440|nr:hypothetical protein [Mesorhizobium sp.]RWA98212.1 MAG: hypothetical protein EOQ33_28415 [Mesorhizobium sp.]
MTKVIEHTSRGKWSRSGVPHKGWTCVGVDDLEEPSQECEMCESVDIRYVHYMEHPDHSDILAVGCVCAENMEKDYVRPREREMGMRRIARRRKSWAERDWRVSQLGNPFLNSEGFNLIVFERGDGFSITVSRRGADRRQVGKKCYPSQDQAKAAALGALMWAKSHL